MKKRKTPMRTCVVTQEVKPKKELIRVCATKNGEVSVDLNGKAPGRGAYLTLKEEIVLKALKTNILDRKLQTKVPKEIYDELLELAKNAK